MCLACNKKILLRLSAGPDTVKEFIGKELGKCPAMRALEDLTPSGSEFYEDPKRCYDFARSSREGLWQMVKDKVIQVKKLEQQIQDGATKE